MKHLDLFSGIGGFALAAKWAGFETVGFSEIDPYASAVLNKNFPNVKNYGDIRTITRDTCHHRIAHRRAPHRVYAEGSKASSKGWETPAAKDDSRGSCLEPL